VLTLLLVHQQCARPRITDDSPGDSIVVSNTVQRNDGNAFPKTSLVNEILSNLRVLDDNIIKSTTCGDLERGCFVIMEGFKVIRERRVP